VKALLHVAIVLLCFAAIGVALTWPAESTVPDLVYGQF
jgi:hypothetical protein